MHSQIYESALQSTQLLFAWSCTGRMSICSSLWFGLIFDIGSLRKVLQSNPCPILLILNLNLLNLREVIRYLFLVEPIPKNKGQSPDLDKWTSEPKSTTFTRNYCKKYQECIKIRLLSTITMVKLLKQFIWVSHLWKTLWQY